MAKAKTRSIPKGWIGGFMESNPAFAYPKPDLSSLPMLGNMENIDKLTRQQAAIWPQFSWLTVPGDESSRCFQMFAPDISRIGYTDRGRVYSVICPQQGSFSPSFGTLNIEVTVTGNRGWVDEPSKTLAADISVEGNIWFSPSAHENFFVKMLWGLFADNGLPFRRTRRTRSRSTSTTRKPDQAGPAGPDGRIPPLQEPRLRPARSEAFPFRTWR